MKKYVIYFNQVNQTRFEIKAKNLNNALKRAEKEWKQDNVTPCWYAEDENGNAVLSS